MNSITRVSRAATAIGIAFSIFAFTATAFAAASPAGCTADNSVVNIASSVSTAAAGDVITFSVNAGNPTSTDGCDVTGRTMTLTLPDGTQSIFGPFNYPNPTALQFVGSAPYTANNADAVGGFWTANVSWNGTLKSSADLPSTGSKNASVVQKGHIIVDKVTVPSGSSQSFAFTTTGNGYSSFDLTDAAAPNDQTLDAGSYSVSEGAVTGWDQTSAVCDGQGNTPASINLAAGQTVHCTFTNTQQKGHLIVQKTTIPGGDPTAFTITASGTGTITGGGAGTVTDATDKDYEVTPGTYNVAETVPAGWTKTGDTCQGVAVAAGQTATCLLTNTKNPNTTSLSTVPSPGSGDVGAVLNDSATLSGAVSPTGSIDFSLYAPSDATCSGSAVYTQSVPLTGNTAATSPGYTSIAAGIYHWKADYLGDANNTAAHSGCTAEPVTITQPVVQYCSPGYWKNHSTSWVGYTPSQSFSSIFDAVTILWSAKGKPMPLATPTLQQGLEANGGGINQLVRATINALLNTSAGLTTGWTTQGIIAAFDAAVPGTDAQYSSLASQFTAPENCPLN